METILLIEDNLDILDNLSEYLEIEGYRLLTAKSGLEGIELARKFKPDLIICDMIMPEMNGYEVLHSILGTVGTSGIPFIFNTSMSERKEMEEALKQGADDYIIKPFELETLLKKIKALVKEGSKRQKCIFKQFGLNPFAFQFNFPDSSLRYSPYF